MWKVKEVNKEKELALQKQGKHKFLARILSQNESEADKMDEFLSTDYKDLSHPYELNDVEKASKLFIKHAKNGSRVAIIGDYDCDGITSTTMLYELCLTFGLTCIPFLPSRLDHGYGLNEKTIQAFKRKVGNPPDLLIVTDCGTNNRAEVAELKEFGIEDIIIIDHHLPSNEEVVSRNADALVSWHFSGDYNEMCACGEVYQFIRGIRCLTKKVDPLEFLTYAAIGTLADSQPIVGDNRIIVKNGLTQFSFNNICASGLNSLIKKKIKYSSEITQTDIEFRIAPMINAAGRIETPDVVLRLLVEVDPELADEMATKVIKLNEERKHLQTFIETGAIKKCENLKNPNGVLLYDESWHIGIVGIVASRIVELTGKPSLVIGYHNGVWKGSGRSIPNVNLKEILDDCSEMLDKYGGHAAAVGLAIKEEYLDRAQGLFDAACVRYYARNVVGSELVRNYNAALTLKAVNEEMATMLKDNLFPYCKSHNSEPIFLLKDVKITNAEVKEGPGWRLMNFNVFKNQEYMDYQFTIFAPKFGTELENELVDVYFTFPKHWDNTKRLQEFSLMAVDVVKKT